MISDLVNSCLEVKLLFLETHCDLMREREEKVGERRRAGRKERGVDD